MKGPGNITVRLDLFDDKNNSPDNNERNFEMKSNSEESQILKWNDIEQMNRQVIFINPEWDEIEEEKAGIPAFLNSITPKKSASPQPIEFVATDTESVSSMTVSLDELIEESEEIVTVITDSEPNNMHDEMEPLVAEFSENKLPKPSSYVADARNWKVSDATKINLETGLMAPPVIKISKGRPLINSNESVKNYEPLESNKLMKASCYIVQNGKVTKPFYIVKNPILRTDGIYRGDTKMDDLFAGKIAKNLDGIPINEEVKNLLPLGRQNAGKKKESFQEAQFSKSMRNQDYIKIIEHPAKEKRIMINKPKETRVKAENTFKKPVDDDAAKFKKNVTSDSANSCESEDLMWLLDFKLDDLFSESSLPALSHLDDNLEYSEFPGKYMNMGGSAANVNVTEGDRIGVEIGCQTDTTSAKMSKTTNGKTSSRQNQKGENKAESSQTNRTFNDLKYSENRKPPFTYTELIECALQERGPLTVSEIYNWISETFPYYKSWDDRWKNSVRHNLSINPYFRKGTKARQGSGHLWTVNKSDDNSKINNWKRQRFHEFEEFNKRLRLTGETEVNENSSEFVHSGKMMDETELATASIEDKENRKLHKDVLMAACVDNNLISASNVSLEQSAEEILSGVKKTVEVQYLEPVKSTSPCENDFLNPISKEILIGECGLLNQIELNLTAETGENLSIVDGIADSEHIFGISDELNFQYDISNHPPQLLSLAK